MKILFCRYFLKEIAILSLTSIFGKNRKKDDGQNDEVAEKSSDIFSAVGGRMLKCCIDFLEKIT